jgi:hypothetical protein
MDLATLISGGGSVDFFSLLERAFDQMALELARHEGVPGLGQEPPEELLATAVGNRLARMIVAERSPRALPPGTWDAAGGARFDHHPAGGSLATGPEDPARFGHEPWRANGWSPVQDVEVVGATGAGDPASNAAGDELAERDLALAEALGACDCWGQDPRCHICEGEGGPGWILPDRRLFATYVQPAIRAIRAQAANARTRPSVTHHRTTTNEPKENGNAGHPR